MISVMGAGGNVGSKVVDLLLRENQTVRALEHARKLDELAERGAEVVTGDAADVDVLRSLFEGADAALVLLPENLADPEFVATRSRISRALAQALRDRPVHHVVALSAAGVEKEDVAGPPAGLREYEQQLARVEEINALVLRSAFYMDYLLANLPLIQAQKLNGSAIAPDVAFPMVATQDVGREAAERLLRRDFTGYQIKLLLGPEDVTMRQATHVLGSLLGMPNLPYVQFPPADMKRALLGAGASEEAASLLVEMQLALNEGRQFDGVRRTAETATPTRLDDFLATALSDGRIP